MTNQVTQQQRSKRRAAKAGLTFVNDFDEGYSRRRCGNGFSYLGVDGQTLKDERIRKRIQSLVIPPAWEDVWICPSADGHVQARGRDDADRLQYIYHTDWQAVSTMTKFDRMSRFAEVLPRVRRRVRKDLNRKRLSQQRVLAAVVRLLDRAHLRIGSEQSEQARGATTLSDEHVSIGRHRVSLDFPGKSGQRRELDFADKKLVAVMQRCEELDGQFLFSYQDDDGTVNPVSSTLVNAYLQEIADDQITAKDFRTWAGSTTALAELSDLKTDASERDRTKACVEAVKTAAETLGNTVSVCRKSYIHPGILAAAESGELPWMLDKLPGDSLSEMTIDDVRFKELLPHLDFS